MRRRAHIQRTGLVVKQREEKWQRSLRDNVAYEGGLGDETDVRGGVEGDDRAIEQALHAQIGTYESLLRHLFAMLQCRPRMKLQTMVSHQSSPRPTQVEIEKRFEANDKLSISFLANIAKLSAS